jgi:hypothetical protein
MTSLPVGLPVKIQYECNHQVNRNIDGNRHIKQYTIF